MKNMNNKHGFTLVEILTAVIIVAILTVMAMPLYERTIERARLAEARTIMSRIQDAKLAAMDEMGCEKYPDNGTATPDDCPVPPRFQHLRVAFVDEVGNNKGNPAKNFIYEGKDFYYDLITIRECSNGVMAVRQDGEHKNTAFLYYGSRQDGKDPVFYCVDGDCEYYGLEYKQLSRVNCDE